MNRCDYCDDMRIDPEDPHGERECPYCKKRRMILQGDCIEKMKELPENSVDAIVTDPPYGIGFMGKEWDNFKPSTIQEGMEKDTRPKTQIASTRISNIAGTYDTSIMGARGFQKFCQDWSVEALRILKPGGFMLVSCSTRMYHRMTCGIEDAGFEIRDTIMWLYGSGFPKSLNIGKQIDKIKGNKRETIGFQRRGNSVNTDFMSGGNFITKGTSKWEGWGTALKPACEPIVVARKPLSEKNVALNVLKWGTGGINIDACRIEGGERDARENNISWGISRVGEENAIRGNKAIGITTQGRFPSNIILDEEAGKILDEQSGILGSNSLAVRKTGNSGGTGNVYQTSNDVPGNIVSIPGKGGASRFFYCAKASKSERNYGCEDIEEKQQDESRKEGNPGGDNPRNRGVHQRKNNHPTVKPIKLMEYLIKLVSREGSTVLDPFLGSGTTAIACQKLGRNWIGIEKETEYIKIAEARLKPYLEQRTLFSQKVSE